MSIYVSGCVSNILHCFYIQGSSIYEQTKIYEYLHLWKCVKYIALTFTYGACLFATNNMLPQNLRCMLHTSANIRLPGQLPLKFNINA